MNELVERLRFNASAGVPDFTNRQLLDDAANRIEALEAALRKIAEWPPSSRIDVIVNAFIDARLFARAALDKDAGK